MLFWLSIEETYMNLLGILLISARPTGDFQGSMTLFLTIFFLIAIGLIVFGIVLYKKRAVWIQKSITTYGRIVEISKRYARDDHSGRFPIYFPIVAYQVNGLEFRRKRRRDWRQPVRLVKKFRFAICLKILMRHH